MTRSIIINPLLRDSLSLARDPEAILAEAVGLGRAINLEIFTSLNMAVVNPVPSTLFGSGQVARVRQLIADNEIILAVINHPLSPGQQRNLEKEWHCKVIDRTGLILEIFGDRARTREGQLQVELASLDYQRSRLVRSWTHLERQRGGFGFMGGPGESQLEIDKRLINGRIDRIKSDLADVRRTRGLQRRARARRQQPVVALVGYTNAGKSTLFNRLSAADVLAQDLLFATLDPTMRQVKLGGNKHIMLSDTVGFIADLPTQLIESFRATLEEVTEADLIIHVRDIAHRDTDAQKADVLEVLGELGIKEGEPRLIEVWNKVDMLMPERLQLMQASQSQLQSIIMISALTGEGLEGLLNLIDDKLFETRVTEITVPVTRGDLLAWLYDNAAVNERQDNDDGISLSVELTAQALAQYEELAAKT